MPFARSETWLRVFCFPLGPPFHPMLLLRIFSYTKSSVGDFPTPPPSPSRHETVGKLASKPHPHSGLKGVISFLSCPQRQGKETSTAKQRAPTAWVAHKPTLEKLQLGRSSLDAAPPSPPHCRAVTPTNPQSVCWGPFSFTRILSHSLSNQQAVLGLALKNPR